MLFYSSLQEGYLAVFEHFNGLQELYKRDDIASYLLDKYSSLNLNTRFTIENKYSQYRSLLDVVFIETILAQPEINEKMTATEKDQLHLLLQQNYQLTQSYSGLAPLTTDSAYTEVANYIETADGYTYEVVNILTPMKSNATAFFLRSEDYAYMNRELIAQLIKDEYPGVSISGSSTAKYNCHAYAWIKSSSFWLDDPTPYRTDGTYTKVSADTPMAIGQVIYYTSPGDEHSGRVISTTGNCIESKWGQQSLVKHTIENCPYLYYVLVEPYQFYVSDFY